MDISYSYLMDRMEFLAKFPDKWFELILDDPEWGIGAATMAFTRETNCQVKQKNGTKLKIDKKAYKQKDWDIGTPPQEYLDELKRVSQNQIIFGIEYMNWSGVGPGRLIWDKLRPAGLSFKPTEVAYQSFDNTEHTIKCLWSGMMQAKSVEQSTVQQGNKKLNEKRIHPTQKPVILWKLALKEFGVTPGSRIGAPNSGSGSNRIACWDLDLPYWGCDRDPDYFHAAEEWFVRHKNSSTQLTIQ